MVSSMTGYGRGEASKNGLTVSVEIRSVNNRFLEVTTRLPRLLSQREKEIKDLIRGALSRGTVNVMVKLDQESGAKPPMKVNTSAAKSYYRLLNELRRSVKLREKVKLEHLLSFSDILEPVDAEETDEKEWQLLRQGMTQALADLNEMRAQEGRELVKDLDRRIRWMNETLNSVEALSIQRIPDERKRLNERIVRLVEDKKVIDQNRLELEIALLADKLDVTEECVRFRSHNKFFLEALNGKDAAGRKLNFLVQEMNREANTIGSKANDPSLAHLVVSLKEELEKIREQLQNIE